MSIILWKIIIVSIILVETMIGAFLGWRVLALMKRVKDVQKDRNDVDDERRKQSDQLRQKGIEIDKLVEERNKLRLRELESLGGLVKVEKKMILASLNMPEYGNAIQDPKTSFQVRKVYRDLKEKIKESLKD